MATLQLKNVNKIYPNGVQAVFDFNIDIQPGEFIVFVGPSGCGKSTTLRMIAGLEEISSGDLMLDDARINELSPKDRDVAMVFQNYALYAHMTVYHNMAFSLILRKENSDFIHERVMWAAEVLGLTPYLNRKPQQLSGGQRQRVALGRAIVRDPKIFLLDEPLSNLDAKLRGIMRKELKLLHHRLQTTMIYVTHDQIEALTLADRIVIMKDGYVQQIGTPVEVYQKPKNLFVANFMGTPPMNFFNAKLDASGKLMIGEDIMDVSSHPSFQRLEKENYFDKDIIVGIRPEFIRIEKKTSFAKGYPSTVDIYELLGSDALVHFNIGEKSVTAKIDARHHLAVGDEILFEFDVEHIYFFDKESEEVIYG
jgi:multiple sugar transport system ATP-binding protein